MQISAGLIALAAVIGLSEAGISLTLYSQANCAGSTSVQTVNADGCNTGHAKFGSFVINASPSNPGTLSVYKDGSGCAGSTNWKGYINQGSYPQGCQDTNGLGGAIGYTAS